MPREKVENIPVVLPSSPIKFETNRTRSLRVMIGDTGCPTKHDR